MMLRDALAWSAGRGLDRLDGQLLLLHALGRPLTNRAWLIAHDDEGLTPEQQARFEAACTRRVGGEPLAYLVGRQEFHGLDLQVDPRVLVPRPDTETLVDWALDLLPPDAPWRVVDLGTGSGAIALAVQHARPRARVEAVDRSEAAAEVARANAQRLGLPVTVRVGHWLDGIADRFQLILSNPPYVAEGDSHLAALTHEPRGALVAGVDGLDDLRAIVAHAPARLLPGGWLLLEHGHDQAARVRALLEVAGFAAVQSRRDLAGIERCSGGQWLELG